MQRLFSFSEEEKSDFKLACRLNCDKHELNKSSDFCSSFCGMIQQRHWMHAARSTAVHYYLWLPLSYLKADSHDPFLVLPVDYLFSKLLFFVRQASSRTSLSQEAPFVEHSRFAASLFSYISRTWPRRLSECVTLRVGVSSFRVATEFEEEEAREANCLRYKQARVRKSWFC